MLGLHSELTFWELDRLFEIVDIVWKYYSSRMIQEKDSQLSTAFSSLQENWALEAMSVILYTGQEYL